MRDNKQKGSGFSKVSAVWAKNEKKKKYDKKVESKEKHPHMDAPGKNYWDSVAEDVAKGYKSKEDESRILNEDQEPGDNERGDKAAE
jgi:hypothetical protein